MKLVYHLKRLFKPRVSRRKKHKLHKHKGSHPRWPDPIHANFLELKNRKSPTDTNRSLRCKARVISRMTGG